MSVVKRMRNINSRAAVSMVFVGGIGEIDKVVLDVSLLPASHPVCAFKNLDDDAITHIFCWCSGVRVMVFEVVVVL